LDVVRRLRLEVQRLFEGAKARNVEPYAQYIVNVHRGQAGMTPPLVAWTEKPLAFEEKDDGTAHTLVPWDTPLVMIDAETQLAARFESANMEPETRQGFVPVLICHGRPIEWARQVFHDLNLLGVRPNAAIGISMDARDPLTHVAREIEQQVPFFSGRVNTVRRQLRKNESHVLTITALRGACVTLAEGIAGVKHGAKPVPVDPSKVAQIQSVAIEWFSAVADAIGAAMEDRNRTVAAGPAVFAAIGAMGHELVAIADAGARTARRDELLERLRLVRWDKGPAWDGIAGKLNPKGTFSVGGSKETAYAVYAALTDRTSAGYGRIRGNEAPSTVAA
jgi:DNA sulfur modification protein DndB